MALRIKNSVLLAKVEVTEGTDVSPTGTDAILVENLRVTPSANLINTDEVTGSLDGAGPIVGGMKMDVTFDVFLKGSGAAGTAPEFSSVLKACGWSETVTGTAVPSSAEAAAAGTTSTLTLSSGATGTANLYRGMPINLTVNPAAGDTTLISAYTSGKVATLTDTYGTALDNTTEYQIPINVRYSPGSSSIPTVTLYAYMDGLLYIIVGARGTMQLTLESGGIGRMSFTMTGMFSSKTDTSVVTATYDSTRPPVWKNGKMTIGGSDAAVQSITLDMGNTLANPDNPNSLEGFDPAIITRRDLTGTVNPLETLMATRTIMTDFRNGTTRSMGILVGSTTGNKVGITIPAALYTARNPGDRDGLSTEDVTFAATGQEAGAFLCFF